MSFITKRERVFNEYDLFDLPNRNEGKLKAYASCTDARAWSHFGSDKTEHLVELIKRNNETCRAKYVPTDVIVNTLMGAKNAEITRLRRKIEEFEQMIAAYDQLDLTCEQKCEIAIAHAAIKEANKELDDLCLTLDLSGFTEGIDSEGFQTGKSSGDEPDKSRVDEIGKIRDNEWSCKKETKANQVELQCTCDASTAATDPRIEEMQETIINKDAKLNAMQNTIAVMENDVCEPYCIYAHIYTALEKIFGILCQNDKYKMYLSLLTSGKDTRCIDIKGRILYKLKVLEKFSLALIAPCTHEFVQNEEKCYHAEVITRVETTFSLTSSENEKPMLDSKRAQLVADIMENDEMKELLGRSGGPEKSAADVDEPYCIEDYSIDTENLNRLKNLQLSYDELMTCYENLKHERDCLKIRCEKYDELEKEFLNMQSKLREYNTLWNEKEHYRKRSEALDSLKEQYLILTDETSNLETQLKAETEINSIKNETVDELRSVNISLEKRLNDATITFEREKNTLHCKLKECECRVMCQEEQIKSLSEQIDILLEQGHREHSGEDETKKCLVLLDQIEHLKEQIINLQEGLYASEEEKQQLQEFFQDKLKLTNELNIEIEEWKSKYLKAVHCNDCLKQCSDNLQDQRDKLINEKEHLANEIQEKTEAVRNLMEIINKKSQEVNRLMEHSESTKKKNDTLSRQLQEIRNSSGSMAGLLEVAREESRELLDKIKDRDDLIHKNDDILRLLESKKEDYNRLREEFENKIKENRELLCDLENQNRNNALLRDEISRVREINDDLANSLHNFEVENKQYRNKEREYETKLTQLGITKQRLESLQHDHQRLLGEKHELQNMLYDKSNELEHNKRMIELTKKESNDAVDKSEALKNEIKELNETIQKTVQDKALLQTKLIELQNTAKSIEHLEQELEQVKISNKKLLTEKSKLEQDLSNQSGEIKELLKNLEEKLEENQNLKQLINALRVEQEESLNVKAALESVRKESTSLMHKLKDYGTLANEFDKLKHSHEQMNQEKETLLKEFVKQSEKIKIIEKEKDDLNNYSQSLVQQHEKMERELNNARNEILMQASPQINYEDIIKEIEELKKEKLFSHREIQDLSEKLEESENEIRNLNETLKSREYRIEILQNHINELQEEVKKLHDNLSMVVDTGEQMKDKIDQSLYKMEAHHSKATHNMKMEIAKLENENAKLEKQLSVTKLKSDESLRDKNKYLSQIMQLQNEKEFIAADIKQLELSSIGDSSLSPDSCKVEDILTSLDKIRKYLQATCSKTDNLEQTVLKVKTSSQLLLSKADEAKKLIEKEKQKAMNEKEEAVVARLHLEQQLLSLSEQIKIDKNTIKDLESENRNHKLIIAKINESTKAYVSKLQDEMKSLQDLYQDSINKVSELQEKVKYLAEERETLNKVKSLLVEKSNEVAQLQNALAELRDKPKKNVVIQTSLTTDTINESTQTKKLHSSYEPTIHNIMNPYVPSDMDEAKASRSMTDINMIIDSSKRQRDRNIVTELLPSQKPQSVNEVQILTANIEPTFDFVRSSYKNYKIKQLSVGRMEHCSISCVTDNNDTHGKSIGNVTEQSLMMDPDNPHLVDIYNRQSTYTESSKVETVEKEKTEASSVEFSNTLNSNVLIESSSDKSNDKDLFVIYQDSESSHAGGNKGKTWNVKGPEILVESMAVESSLKNKPKQISEVRKIFESNHQLDDDIYHEASDAFEKPKLNIELPRVDKYSDKTDKTTEEECEEYSDPLTSFDNDSYKSPKISQPKKIDGNRGSLKPKVKGNNKEKLQSHHKLSRVGANFILIENKNTNTGSNAESPLQIEEPGNFGLEYILESVNHEVNPNPSKIYEGDKNLRQSRSDDLYNLSRHRSSPDPRYSLNGSSTDKTVSFGYSSPTKSVAEQSVLVKIDERDDYENKITILTRALENTEKDYKKKIEAIKIQYDSNIKNIINEHNQGVRSIQNLHEETLKDILSIHENEVENLRSMSIDAMRKADKLEKENRVLKSKLQDSSISLDEEPIKHHEEKKRKCKCRGDTKLLTKTNVEAFNVRPKQKHGPCTCSLDINISDTIRNIFDQVDVEQRKLAEHAYLKYIANKIYSSNVENLDAQELSFLHLKVCRTWKTKLTKEEALQKKIDSLETELLNKQRHAQQHIAELDRKVAEERRRLQEVREAVCRNSPSSSPRHRSPDTTRQLYFEDSVSPIPTGTGRDICHCNISCNVDCIDLAERRSAGDLAPGISAPRCKRVKPENNRAVLAKLDLEERREKKLYNDEPPTRLRRAHAHDRPSQQRQHKK